ncbi:unnamed protein product, partial [Phaeothamnion confervicola]
MARVRRFSGQLLFGGDSPPLSTVTKFPRFPDSLHCARWAVVTSINPPTLTIRQLAALPDWCLVVVADRKSPSKVDYGMPSIVYLTPEDQERLPYRIAHHLPWNHFGRKNIGYLYAIHHGAQVIYDTDDDNELIVGPDG